MNPHHPLDNPVRGSLLHAHAHLADRLGSALRYQPEVAPFVALPDEPDGQTWRDTAALLGAGTVAPVACFATRPPDAWQIVSDIPCVQMVDDGVDAAPDDEAIQLGRADVPAMLALVAQTRPGPFRPRTIELGHYLGIRRGGVLVAMAGERMRPPGWTEISAVCTAGTHRGQGLATRLLRAVAHVIRERGEVPFLHAAAANTTAIRLYRSLGFRLRARPAFVGIQVPAAEHDHRSEREARRA